MLFKNGEILENNEKIKKIIIKENILDDYKP